MLFRFVFIIPSVAPHICWCYAAGQQAGEEDVPLYEIVNRVLTETDTYLSGWMSQARALSAERSTTELM